MNVLVTGGSGRLGRSVITELANANHRVINGDTQLANTPLPGDFVEVDVLDREKLKKLARDADVEVLIHLAGVAEPFSKPEAEISFVNVQSTVNALEVALTVDTIKKVMYAGRINPIGYSNPRGWTPSYLPLDEMHPVAPWNAYTASKVAGELNLRRAVARSEQRLKGFTISPAFVVAPEEWAPSVPGQGDVTIWERLNDPKLAASTLFNYVDARDAASLFATVLSKAEAIPNGTTFFASAPDALARRPLSHLLPQYFPSAAPWAACLEASNPAVSTQNARRLTGWQPVHSWTSQRLDASET